MTWEEMKPQLANPRYSMTGMADGMVLLICGLAKKVLLGDRLAALATQIQGIPYYEITTLAVWMLVVGSAFSLYFTLSGLCDIAQGLGLLFSIRLPQNFRYPYQAAGMDDFFRRFNITVGAFIRRYVFEPLGAQNNGIMASFVNILLFSMLSGLWFGLRLNYLLWGVALGVVLAIEQLCVSAQSD